MRYSQIRTLIGIVKYFEEVLAKSQLDQMFRQSTAAFVSELLGTQ